MDTETDYLHVLLTSMADETSKASLQDVISMSLVLKKMARHYKAAYLPYMSKGNTQLTEQLSSLVVST